LQTRIAFLEVADYNRQGAFIGKCIAKGEKEMTKGFTIRGVVFSAMFAALMVVMSYLQVNLGFTPVPITLQNMAVMLAGALLGAAYGFFSIFLVILLTALGLPLLHGNGGLSYVIGPTGGFLWMFPISAMLVGWFVSRVKGSDWTAYIKIFLIIEIFGSLLTYVSGVPWLAYKLHVSFNKALTLGFYPYILGDVIKAIATTLIVVPIRNVYPAWKLVGSPNAKVAILKESDSDSKL
jgi:biotin transport system substrate-specific component